MNIPQRGIVMEFTPQEQATLDYIFQHEEMLDLLMQKYLQDDTEGMLIFR